MELGCGILAIWHDVRPERLAETLSWYDREHHLERLGVPGFRTVRRYHAVEAEPFLFIRYETDSSAVLTSPDYLARLNAPTEWTQRSQPAFLGNIRSVCTREAWGGWAEGGFAVSVRLTRSGPDAATVTAGWSEASRTLLALDGVVGTELWRADRRSSSVATDEKRLRSREDGYVDWAGIIHATTLDGARAASTVFATAGLATAFDMRIGIYGLAASSAVS